MKKKHQNKINKSYFYKILLAIFSFIIFSFFLEITFRILKIEKTIIDKVMSLESDWYKFSSELGWERNPNFSGNVTYCNCERSFDSEGYLTIDTKQIYDNKPKIIVIGDSCSFGNGVVAESTYPELLEQVIPEVSFINLSVPGYTSYQGYRTLVKYVPIIKPVLVIISFSFNDRRYVLDKKDIDNNIKFKKFYNFVKREKTFEKIYIFRFVQKVAEYLKSKLITNKEYDVTKLTSRVPPDEYEKNISKIIEYMKKKKIPLIFLMLNDNALKIDNIKKGINAFNKLNYNLAINNFNIEIQSDRWYKDLAIKYLVKTYEKMGLFRKAKESSFFKPFYSIHGGTAFYLDTEYNKIIMNVGKKSGLQIVDAGSILNQDTKVYIDYCHFNEFGHAKITKLLYYSIIKIFPQYKNLNEIDWSPNVAKKISNNLH